MIKSIFADVTADGVVRGAATIAEDGGAKTADETQSAGHMVFTVDQGLERENYQGIVEVTENSFLKTFIHYFNQSEQIPTGIRVFIDKDKGQWNARAILLQAIPQYGGEEHQEKHNDKASSKRKEDSSTEDDWRRVMLLLDSCKDEELADGDLSDEDLLMRLFHEDGVVFYDKVIYSKGCRCSRERVESVLYSLNIDDLDDLIVENQITADCEFCGEKFVFDPDDIRATIEAK
jgi:molecular chaperone Hsp33